MQQDVATSGEMRDCAVFTDHKKLASCEGQLLVISQCWRFVCFRALSGIAGSRLKLANWVADCHVRTVIAYPKLLT